MTEFSYFWKLLFVMTKTVRIKELFLYFLFCYIDRALLVLIAINKR